MTHSQSIPAREWTLVVVTFALLTVVLTYPLAFHLSDLGRTDNADGQYSIWNVAWVARTLAVDPRHVFDANIFYPHRGTLAYSEANLGAGLIAMPVYWLTRDPMVAHNVVLLLSFVMSGVATYCLLRYLTGAPVAAMVSGIGFAFCPYLFGHVPHIQLLMTAGLPACLLALHRLIDRPTGGRAVVLGLALTGQMLFCAYYGVMAMMLVGYGVIVLGLARGYRRDRRYWTAVAIAAAVAIATTWPLALPYLALQSDTGFSRSLDAAQAYRADWHMYLASGSFAHAPVMNVVGRRGEFLFPGFVVLALAIGGAKVAWTTSTRYREWLAFYGSLALLAGWASLGPSAGLYRLFYAIVPGFTFLRAPSRFGLLVVLALAVLAGVALSSIAARWPSRQWMAGALIACVIAELVVPIRFAAAPAMAPVYRAMATLPAGPVLELPAYSHQFRFLRARYMLGSTAHWMPLVVAYSDYIPPDFTASLGVLAGFPSGEAFQHLRPDAVRYVVFHLDAYPPGPARDSLQARLGAFAPYLRRVYDDHNAWLYEIVGYPH